MEQLTLFHGYKKPGDKCVKFDPYSMECHYNINIKISVYMTECNKDSHIMELRTQFVYFKIKHNYSKKFQLFFKF